MTHRHRRTQWDDQELHKLFAARLPVLAIPDEFAEQLIHSVLEEIVRHVDDNRDRRQDNADLLLSPSVTTASTGVQETEWEQENRVECLSPGAARRKRVPPAVL